MKLDVKDIKIEAEAKSRATRAKMYADKFPQFIRPGDHVFQDQDWQYKALERYERKRRELAA